MKVKWDIVEKRFSIKSNKKNIQRLYMWSIENLSIFFYIKHQPFVVKKHIGIMYSKVASTNVTTKLNFSGNKYIYWQKSDKVFTCIN